jgi:hypothetical protein
LAVFYISGTNETALKGRFITVVVSVLKMIVDLVAMIIINWKKNDTHLASRKSH